ncbi:MAG: cysteine desulfurase [Clostridia bacterium]|nr:cysteine desulfurase [Clostridia bacterium]
MEEIYLDNSATTKISPRARDKMLSVMESHYGNPSSLHRLGLDSEHLIDEARGIIAASLGITRFNKSELVFTSGGTESNNLAIFGTVFAKKRTGKEKILTTRGEHASVEAPLTQLELQGFEIVRVPTDGGKIDLDYIREHGKGAILATFMHVNNETGALYDLEGAFKAVKEVSPDCVLHADCVQSYLKVKFTRQKIGADLITVSAHKVNGAKGTGALYISPEIIKAKKLAPTIIGGGQEQGLRSGTENVYGICAFGEAVKEHMERLDSELSHMAQVQQYIIEELSKIKGISLNLPKSHAPHIVNITVGGIRSEITLHYLSREGIFISSGSACSSHSKKGLSPALVAFGLKPSEIDSAVRISIGPQSTKEDIDKLVKGLSGALSRLARR